MLRKNIFLYVLVKGGTGRRQMDANLWLILLLIRKSSKERG